ncbi:hypothetical protein [Echinicola pacifica]|nr:hypothetical protein [Echinicola pacifica]
MLTRDFIQLLQLTPKMPVKVEYLPGLYTPDSVFVEKVTTADGDDGAVHIQVTLAEGPYRSNLVTNDIFDQILQDIPDMAILPSSIVTVIYGNAEFGNTELDINEIEVFQGNFTLKLYSTNNLINANRRKEKVRSKTVEPKSKRHFFSGLKNILFPTPLVLRWNPAKL